MSRHSLNSLAHQFVARHRLKFDDWGVRSSDVLGARVHDFSNCSAPEAAAFFVNASMAGLGESCIAKVVGEWPRIVRQEVNGCPVDACLLAQYDSWKLRLDGTAVGMLRGPIDLGLRKDTSPLAMRFGAAELDEPNYVGVYEGMELPEEDEVAEVVSCLGVPADRITLLCASIESGVGGFNEAAQVLKMTMDRVMELVQEDEVRAVREGGDPANVFSPRWICSAEGTCPLPPTFGNYIAALSGGKDAVIKHGEVLIRVRGSQRRLGDDEVFGFFERLPACNHSLWREPYGLLLSDHCSDPSPLLGLDAPARVRVENLDTGNAEEFGELAPDALIESWATSYEE